MTHEGEYIRAAICLPQRLPVYKAGEGHILRRLFHGLPDLLGDQMGIRPAEPEETGLRHPPGQLQEFRQSLPGNGVTHGNHRPLPFPLYRQLAGIKPRVGSGAKNSVSTPLEMLYTGGLRP